MGCFIRVIPNKCKSVVQFDGNDWIAILKTEYEIIELGKYKSIDSALEARSQAEKNWSK